VAIVNETMASRYWPGGNPIGGHIQADLGVNREVIGIVADGRYRSRLEEPEPYLYIPLAQAGYTEMRSFVLRTRRGAPALAGLVRHEVRTIDPDLPEPLIATVSEYLARTATDQRAMALLVSAFGILALTLAVVGIYGVMSYLVSQRTHEFGVRLALGARAGEIVALVIRRGMSTTLIGLGVGLGLALLVGRLLGGFLYDVNPLDPTVYAAVALLIATIATLACYLPARVAARADPCAALRSE
jgi:putative ABC transport system permease protein